ncbi:DUF1289 domain-containing protein [Oceanicella actignis]|uniref:DUF1289 domain-containing protein n=1 Tax=Oceanicella actignis TaxID=1189325 RepID=UPI0011E79506|nr:DUF1289 domain-containing protein [Oceanicella actignis]TYO89213.1 hypothetical protein LY05_01829 [Oceanicella actignis]
MNDEVWRRDEPQSPCVKVCLIHPGAGLCVGCLRSADEIAAWPRMSDDERRALMAELPARRPRLTEAGARPSARRRARRGDG